MGQLILGTTSVHGAVGQRRVRKKREKWLRNGPKPCRACRTGSGRRRRRKARRAGRRRQRQWRTTGLPLGPGCSMAPSRRGCSSRHHTSQSTSRTLGAPHGGRVRRRWLRPPSRAEGPPFPQCLKFNCCVKGMDLGEKQRHPEPYPVTRWASVPQLTRSHNMPRSHNTETQWCTMPQHYIKRRCWALSIICSLPVSSGAIRKLLRKASCPSAAAQMAAKQMQME